MNLKTIPDEGFRQLLSHGCWKCIHVYIKKDAPERNSFWKVSIVEYLEQTLLTCMQYTEYNLFSPCQHKVHIRMIIFDYISFVAEVLIATGKEPVIWFALTDSIVDL